MSQYTLTGSASADIDVNTLSHKKWRRLKAEHPQAWPQIFVAWFALVTEAWKAGDRETTLDEAWDFALTITPKDARDALLKHRLIDKAGRIPADSWEEWVAPALARIEAAKLRGHKAAAARWGVPARAMPEHSNGNAQALPVPSIHPSNTSTKRNISTTRGRTRSRGEATPGNAGPVSLKEALIANGFDPGKINASNPQDPIDRDAGDGQD